MPIGEGVDSPPPLTLLLPRLSRLGDWEPPKPARGWAFGAARWLGEDVDRECRWRKRLGLADRAE